MHETVLRKIVRQREVTGQLAQEVAHMRLVAANKLAESVGIPTGHDPRDELVIFSRQLSTMISAGIPLLESFELPRVNEALDAARGPSAARVALRPSREPL